jgi:multidrug efflux pump
MSGVVGRLFREFAVTMATAILISMVVSLTATPMMCAHLLKEEERHGRLYQWSERAFNKVIDAYGRMLDVVLRFSFVTLLVLIATIAFTIYLYIYVPKGFFPQQDTGRLNGAIQADQDSSFQLMNNVLLQMIDIVKQDPAVANVVGFTGGAGPTNMARLFVALKPLDQRDARADQIIARLRPRLAQVPGATLYLQASQDVRVGGRLSNAQYQFTMQGDNLADLSTDAPKMLQAMRPIRIITEVNSDQQNHGLQAFVTYDRAEAGAIRHRAIAHRFDLVQRIRSAAGVDDVSRAEPVSRRDGGRARVLAERHVTQSGLCAVAAWPKSPSERVCEMGADDGATGGQPPGAVSRGHHLIQPGARRGTR